MESGKASGACSSIESGSGLCGSREASVDIRASVKTNSIALLIFAEALTCFVVMLKLLLSY